MGNDDPFIIHNCHNLDNGWLIMVDKYGMLSKISDVDLSISIRNKKDADIFFV